MSLPPRSSSDQAFGIVEWFRPGDHQHVEEALERMLAAGVTHLRTQLSWAEYHVDDAQRWYDWLLPKLGSQIELMPCVHYTPPSLSRTGRPSGAPRNLKDYADFIDQMLSRYGKHFEAVELWNEPNNLLDYDWRQDHGYELFCEMVGNAAHWIQHRGWRAVLGAPCPFDTFWLDLMGRRGLLGVVSAIGVHGFPGTWDSEEQSWEGWDAIIQQAREVLDRYNPEAEIWITEAGFSTWRSDEMEQVRRFREAYAAPADRLYWYGWRDVAPDVAVQEGLWFDSRHYHMGLETHDGRPKLLARLLTDGGPDALARIDALAAPNVATKASKPVVIAGGSGFIGANLADSFLRDGQDVVILDNLSRPGVEENLDWLRAGHGDRVHPAAIDIRDPYALQPAIDDASAVFNLAAQTAVTTSLDHPRHDFEVNALGTLNILEAARKTGRRIPLIFASTNKVYGNFENLELAEYEDRYLPVDSDIRAFGLGEDRPLDFCTPYGCSKGTADQYVLDYAKSYGMPTAVLRMSCIYGPHQFGTEDQGWVAHFLLRALKDEPITIYGDGKQVRDILNVSDAVDAYRRVLAEIDNISGRALNLGGGPSNAVSLNHVLAEIGSLTGQPPEVVHGDWRAGDQLYFVADTRQLAAATGWAAQTDWRSGIAELADWLAQHRLGIDSLELTTPERIRA